MARLGATQQRRIVGSEVASIKGGRFGRAAAASRLQFVGTCIAPRHGRLLAVAARSFQKAAPAVAHSARMSFPSLQVTRLPYGANVDIRDTVSGPALRSCAGPVRRNRGAAAEADLQRLRVSPARSTTRT